MPSRKQRVDRLIIGWKKRDASEQFCQELLEFGVDHEDQRTELRGDVGVLVEFLEFGLRHCNTHVGFLPGVEQPLFCDFLGLPADVPRHFGVVNLSDDFRHVLESGLDVHARHAPVNLQRARYKVIVSSRFVDVQAAQVIAVARAGTLLAGMGVAAWMDHHDRRVPNRHWIVWSQPVFLLWTLDMVIRGADATVWLTLLLPWAYASGAVIGRPSLADLQAGSKLDSAAVLVYLFALVGLVWGAQRHADVEPIDLILWNLEGAQALWWELIGVTLVLVVIDMAWRLRLLHGGADAKALMWVAMLLPTWGSITWLSSDDTVVLALPPALSILLWGGLAFLLIPPTNLVRNAVRGDLNGLVDLRHAFHAERMALDDVKDSHVWMLSGLEVGLDGVERVVHRVRAPRRTPTEEALDEAILALAALDVQRVWVTRKVPLLVVLWPACVAALVLGDVAGLLFAPLL